MNFFKTLYRFLQGFFLLCACGLLMPAMAQQLATGTVLPTRQTPVHDPVLIKEGATFYVFGTGPGVSVWSSTNLKSWKKEAPVFTTPPTWAVAAVPSFTGHIWAPDIVHHKGQFYLFYSISAFGKNTSCIGVAVSKTLNPQSPDFGWHDNGLLLQSVPGRDNWNAIDPAVSFDEYGTPWLAFGSFWDGIKLVRLAPDLLTVAQPQQWHALARRQRAVTEGNAAAGNAAIEAPFIVWKGGYYYLFVSWDYCCRGAKSDYKVVVGRSEKIAGPYVDKNNKAMVQGGGTLVVAGDGATWFGAGHNAVYRVAGIDYIVYHCYDAADNGRAKLVLQQIRWDAGGWPVVVRPK